MLDKYCSKQAAPMRVYGYVPAPVRVSRGEVRKMWGQVFFVFDTKSKVIAGGAPKESCIRPAGLAARGICCAAIARVVEICSLQSSASLLSRVG